VTDVENEGDDCDEEICISCVLCLVSNLECASQFTSSNLLKMTICTA